MEAIYIVVAALLILYAVMMGRSTMGFRIRILGKNPLFAKASGISSTRVLLVSACIGGALSGLAGLFEVMGVYGVIYSNFASGSLTYMGITAGLLGHYTPLGMLLGGMLLGAMQGGSIMLSTTTKVPGEIVSVIQGLVMFFATVSLFAVLEKRKVKKGKPKSTTDKAKEVAQ